MPFIVATIPDGQPPRPAMISPERLYLTADKLSVVKEGDPLAAFLLVGAGCEIDVDTAKRYGLDFSKAEPPAASEVQSEPVAEVVDPPKPEDAPESPPPPSAPSPATSKTPAFKAVPSK